MRAVGLLSLLPETSPAPKEPLSPIKTYRFKLKPTRSQAQAFAQWHQFVQMLACKARWYGRESHKAAPRHTSRDCWVCGWRNTQLQLSDREWACANGHTLDRDVNAAINIKNKAVGQTVSAWEVYNGSSRVAQESHLL